MRQDVKCTNKRRNKTPQIINKSKIVVRRVTKKKTSKKKKSKTSSMSPIARLLADPCKAPIVPIYGGSSGYTARFSAVDQMANLFGTTANSPSGYLVWFPQYACNGSAGGSTSAVSCYCFASNTNNTPVLNGSLWNGTANTGVSSAATGYANNTLNNVYDPSNAFASGSICEDTRALAACIKLSYSGTTSSNSGMFYPLTNIPLDAVFNGGGSSGIIPTAAQLMRYGSVGYRLDGELEIKFVPDQVAMQFQDVAYGPLQRGSISSDPPTGDPTIARASQPMGFGFAYFGAPALNTILVERVKVVEWRPSPSAGISAMSTNQNIADPSYVQRAIEYLDKSFPNWKTNAAHSAMDTMTSMLRNVVLGGNGPPQRLTRGRIGL